MPWYKLRIDTRVRRARIDSNFSSLQRAVSSHCRLRYCRSTDWYHIHGMWLLYTMLDIIANLWQTGATSSSGQGPYPITVPSPPAAGGSGRQSGSDYNTPFAFDATSTFAYAQLGIVLTYQGHHGLFGGVYCAGVALTVDDVSLYQV